MGRRITYLSAKTTDISIVGGLEAPGATDIGKDIGEVSGAGSLGARIWSAEDIGSAIDQTRPRVLVDFTNAEASTRNVVAACERGLAVVMGTTGHSTQQMERILTAARDNRIPAVVSPNMSMAMNVLFEMSAMVAKMLPSYDVEILEIHHNQKIDSPSGTALELGRRVSRALGRDPERALVLGRSGKGRRDPEEVGIASLRAGDVVGEHTVLFAGLGERIELTHRAQSRDAFVSGVLSSIRFVSKAKPGVYSVMDVLRSSGGE